MIVHREPTGNGCRATVDQEPPRRGPVCVIGLDAGGSPARMTAAVRRSGPQSGRVEVLRCLSCQHPTYSNVAAWTP